MAVPDDQYAFKSVPIINFSQLQNQATRDRALAELRNAIFVVGFLYLTHTGLEVISFPSLSAVLFCSGHM